MLLMSLDKVEKEKDELGDSNSQHQGHRRILTNAPRRRGGQTALMERSGRLGGCGRMEGVHSVMRKPYGRPWAGSESCRWGQRPGIKELPASLSCLLGSCFIFDDSMK